MTLGQRAERLKAGYLNGKEVIKFMMFLGYEFNNQGFTTIRAERTPSVRVRKDGLIKDFGSGWSGDLIALLQEYQGLSFKEAVEYIEKVLNVS